MIVVKSKDIFKYMLKILLIISFLILISKIVIFNNKNKEIPKLISLNQLISCIDLTIPEIKEVNSNKEIETNKENIYPYKIIIGSQLAMLNNIKINDINIEDNKFEKNNEDNNEDKVEQAEIDLSTQVIESNVPTKFTNSFNGVQIKNETSYELNEEILKPDVEITSKDVLIFHTHTCESYTPSEKFNYEQTGTYRTTDLNYNVVRVGDELTKQLESYSFNVYHDKTYHDYPSYTGSYGRSLETVGNLLKTRLNTELVIDIHRDAIGDYTYAPTVKIGNEEAARLMFVIGTDGGGLEHPNWNQNLKTAIKLQEKANELYPGLFKPIILRNSRYNQNLTKSACIIEVGATGNTMEQCLNSMKYLAKIINETIK